nr:hypothetical protein [Enterobacter sp.]
MLCVMKGKTGRAMAPSGSPSVPAGSSSPTTPDSCLRTRQAQPNPQAVSGWRYGLMADVNGALAVSLSGHAA